MKNTLVLVLALLLPVLGAAQQTEKQSPDSADSSLKEVIFLAALKSDNEEFDTAWSAYVRDNYDGMDVAATIDKVVEESADFLRQTNAPGHGSTRRALSNRELREKMQALADAAVKDNGH